MAQAVESSQLLGNRLRAEARIGTLLSMADDVDFQVRMSGKDAGNLAQHRRPGGLPGRPLAGIEHNPIQDVDGQLALQLGDGHILGFQAPPAFHLRGSDAYEGRLLFGLQLADARAALGQLVLQPFSDRPQPGRVGTGGGHFGAGPFPPQRFFSQEANPNNPSSRATVSPAAIIQVSLGIDDQLFEDSSPIPLNRKRFPACESSSGKPPGQPGV